MASSEARAMSKSFATMESETVRAIMGPAKIPLCLSESGRPPIKAEFLPCSLNTKLRPLESTASPWVANFPSELRPSAASRSTRESIRRLVAGTLLSYRRALMLIRINTIKNAVAVRARPRDKCENLGSFEIKLFSVTLAAARSEEHTSELQSLRHLVCRLLLE